MIKCATHLSNLLDGKNKYNDLVFEAQRNQFRIMLRMIRSSTAMRQWPNELYLQFEFGNNVGNTGQSEKHCAKLIKFTANKVSIGLNIIFIGINSLILVIMALIFQILLI